MAFVVDIAEFLRRHPPFAEFDPSVVDLVAEAVEVELPAPGAVTCAQVDGPSLGAARQCADLESAV